MGDFLTERNEAGVQACTSHNAPTEMGVSLDQARVISVFVSGRYTES